MNLNDTIALIDRVVLKKITAQCNPLPEKCKSHGRVRPLYSQLDDRVLLIDTNNKKVTIESSLYDFQSAHMIVGGQPDFRSTYGDFEQITHILQMQYIVCSKNELDYLKVLGCFEKIPSVSISNYILTSEQVIATDWRMPINQRKNISPNVFAFRVNYQIKTTDINNL